MSEYDLPAAFHARSSNSGNEYGMAATRVDVLSQVLTLIRLRGELVYSGALMGARGIAFAPGPSHFYYVEEGTLSVGLPGIEPVRLEAGDLVLLPHGTGHTIADGPAIPVQQIEAMAPPCFDGTRLTLRCGEGEITAARFIGGFFRFEGGPLPSVLSALPPLIHIPRQESGAPAWLQAISHFLIDEAHEARPGAALMISRLIDLLVIRTLRTWAASRPTNHGWLAGLAEERIGRVLSAMHADPYRDWNVEALASIAAMSRSIFTARFASTVGEPPLRYLTRWRLTIAADLLRTGGLKVTEAAQRVGYSSDAAFSRAFKAHFGYAPSEAKHVGR